MPTANESGKTPERATEAFPSWVWLAGAGALLAIGWAFILFQNGFHLTVSVFFMCLGYGAGVAAVYTLFRAGASAVSGSEDDGDGDDAGWGRPVGARAELEREKKALLKAIKEAEFDLQMGKLSKADAEAMIAAYRAQAIAVIREIDRKESGDATAREQIEREVRARLEVAKAKKAGEADRRQQGKKGKKQPATAAKKPEPAAEKVAEKADEKAAEKAAAKTDEKADGKAAAKADEAAAKADEADEAEAKAAAKADSTDHPDETAGAHAALAEPSNAEPAGAGVAKEATP